MPAIEKTEKEKKAEAKAEAKIIDENDESFCGFANFQIVDQDGYNRVIKGSNIGGPLRLTKAGGKVAIESSFTANALSYLQIQRDSNLFLTGDLWFGEAKKSPLNLIGKVVPKTCEALVNNMDKDKSESFPVQVEVPFLSKASSRLATMTVTTKEEKFISKVVAIKLELTDADWMEWKQYRLRFWRSNKAWGGSAEKEEDEKKDEKKGDDNKV